MKQSSFKLWLYTIGGIIGNPIGVAIAFVISSHLDLLPKVETNVVAVAYPHLTISILIAFFALRFGTTRLLYLFSNKDICNQEVLCRFISSHKAFIIFTPVVIWMSQMLEGNIIGFIYLPIMIVATLVLCPIVFVNIVRGIKKESDENYATSKTNEILIWLLLALGIITTITCWISWDIEQYKKKKTKKILLESVPIDPRSLFSGDYVIVNLKIAQPQKYFGNINPRKENFDAGQKVYVGLEKGANEFWEAREISADMANIKKFSVKLVGHVHSNRHGLKIRYGLERFFVPQKQGLKIERADNVSVEVAVAPNGDSDLTRAFIAGQEVKFKK